MLSIKDRYCCPILVTASAAATTSAASRRVLIMRTSTDSGETWSPARIILPEYTRGQSPSGSIFRMRDDVASRSDTTGRIRYEVPPKSLKLKLAYNENTRQVRIFYTFDGADPVVEIPESKAGIYFGGPLTESAAIFLLFSSGSMDIDHFEIEPLGP